MVSTIMPAPLQICPGRSLIRLRLLSGFLLTKKKTTLKTTRRRPNLPNYENSLRPIVLVRLQSTRPSHICQDLLKRDSAPVGLDHFSLFFSRALAQRAVTAFRAIAWRCSGVILWSRALPPFRPNATAFGSFRFFVISTADVISAILRNQ
jgi:hypothetical protein